MQSGVGLVPNLSETLRDGGVATPTARDNLNLECGQLHLLFSALGLSFISGVMTGISLVVLLLDSALRVGQMVRWKCGLAAPRAQNRVRLTHVGVQVSGKLS